MVPGPEIEDDRTTIKLRLVVGESRGRHRREPSDPFADPMLIRAATSDGVAGAELLLGLLRGTSINLNQAPSIL